jgi:serine/threonine-protein kinase
VTPEHWKRVAELFEAAVEHEPAARAEFLARAAAGDAALAEEVLRMLASDENASAFLNGPPAESLGVSDDRFASRLELLREENPSLAKDLQTLLKEHDALGDETFLQAGAVAPAAPAMLIGRQLGRYTLDGGFSSAGRYELQAIIGTGGMGQVYRAKDTRLGREVAVKVLPEAAALDRQAVRRFEREAHAVAALSHPNILAIHDFGSDDDVWYAVTELLEGETLRSALGSGALGWPRALEIGASVADGLAAAHAKGVIHRDLKPENIFLTSAGGVKVLDFGLARIRGHLDPLPPAASTTNQTVPGTILGTIGYMSPEQVRGHEVNTASDIFSFGCVLYEMVSGRRPFARDTVADSLAATLDADPPRLAAPSELERIIRQCLEKQPAKRFTSGREVAQALQVISGGTRRQAKVGPRFRLRAWLVGAMAILLLAIAGALITRQNRGGRLNSLAILPFVNVSANPDVEYMSDGITETLINSLSTLPQLTVMSRESAFQYKGRNVSAQAAGRELGVKAVLTGRAEQKGDDLFIAAELVEVGSNRQLWGERYDRKSADLLTIQQEIAKHITEKLQITLSRQEQARLSGHRPEVTEAYRLYLKGRYYLGTPNEAEIRKGLSYFNQAIDLDPNYALAYVGIADAYYWLSNLYLPPKEAIPKARAAALRALELDDSVAEAHASLATIKSVFDWDWPGAEQAYRRAIELKPGYASAHHRYGMHLVAMGRPKQALTELMRAQECDPLSVSIAVTAVWPLFFAPPGQRRVEQAVRELTKIKSLHRDFAPTHWLLATVYTYQGKHEEAIAELEKGRELGYAVTLFLPRLAHVYGRAGKYDLARKSLQELEAHAKQQYVSPYYRALAHIGLQDYDQAFEWLNKAYEDRDEEMMNLKVDPVLDPLRNDPRFRTLLQRMRLDAADPG